jgi:hypothetical protein
MRHWLDARADFLCRRYGLSEDSARESVPELDVTSLEDLAGLQVSRDVTGGEDVPPLKV